MTDIWFKVNTPAWGTYRAGEIKAYHVVKVTAKTVTYVDDYGNHCRSNRASRDDIWFPEYELARQAALKLVKHRLEETKAKANQLRATRGHLMSDHDEPTPKPPLNLKSGDIKL